MKAESRAIIFGRYCLSNITYVYKDELKYIRLKPLSSISDEDAKLLGYNSAIGFKNGIEILELSQSESEILQQLGYATPQTVIEDGKVVTYSVEELVSNGTFKLI